MAKRMTETGKWMNPSFRKLPTKIKVLFLYLLDSCDSAGVIHLDFDLISVILNEEFNGADLDDHLSDKFFYLSEKKDKIIIKNYIAFQNGDIRSAESNIAKSIRSTLSSHGILDRYCTGEFGHVSKCITI